MAAISFGKLPLVKYREGRKEDESMAKLISAILPGESSLI